jgi:DNA-binding NtrC family response regulator
MEKRTVLFVDDDEIVLMSLQRGLRDEPYNKVFARSGKDALRILKDNDVHVVVTDMRMPEMSGLEFLKIVKENYPNVVRIVFSGYIQVTTLLTAINQGEIYRYIPKPWKVDDDFKAVIRQAMEYYNLNEQRDMMIAQLMELQAQNNGKIKSV